MLSRAGKLNLLLAQFDGLDINTFKKRKVLQKTIYILHEMGMNFRYSYNWYIHGPYSPELAEDAYEIAANKKYYDDEIAEYRYKEKANGIIARFKELFINKLDDDEWLELVSSLLFLKNNYKLGSDSIKLKNLLIERKPKFESKKSLVTKAIQLITLNFS